jgi:hypothetical protein
MCTRNTGQHHSDVLLHHAYGEGHPTSGQGQVHAQAHNPIHPAHVLQTSLVVTPQTPAPAHSFQLSAQGGADHPQQVCADSHTASSLGQMLVHGCLHPDSVPQMGPADTPQTSAQTHSLHPSAQDSAKHLQQAYANSCTTSNQGQVYSSAHGSMDHIRVPQSALIHPVHTPTPDHLYPMPTHDTAAPLLHHDTSNGGLAYMSLPSPLNATQGQHATPLHLAIDGWDILPNTATAEAAETANVTVQDSSTFGDNYATPPSASPPGKSSSLCLITY